MNTLLLCCAAFLSEAPLVSGDHVVRMTVDDRSRSYRIHIPESYDSEKPTPIVLIFHGSSMNAKSIAKFSGMNEKSDEAGFIAVYPNGTGTRELFLTFNAGEELDPSVDRPDDVKFTAQLLDDLAGRVNVDKKRVFAAGLSSGGMMCYRLAAELPGRLAAIAPIAGTMAVPMPEHAEPISVIHFHGTDDAIVPYGGPDDRTPESVRFRSVDDSIRLWTAANDCHSNPTSAEEMDRVDDGTRVTRVTFGPGKGGAEVVVYAIEGGGHTWPGHDTLLKKTLGRSTHEISANDLMWDFFCKHPLP
jgi:polyhydroxybutyrate depolymerase